MPLTVTSRYGCLLLTLLYLPATVAEYHLGDFIPLARRAQFKGTRTVWHDAVTHTCPRFAQDRLTVMTLPRPVGFADTDDYKLALSFDGEQYLTPWLTIISEKLTFTPMVTVKLSHRGTELRSMQAVVEPVPQEFIQKHAEQIDAFNNVSHWPKHLLMNYEWTEEIEVDELLGINFLLGIGVIAVMIMIVSIYRAYYDKIAKLVEELADEEEDEAEKKD